MYSHDFLKDPENDIRYKFAGIDADVSECEIHSDDDTTTTFQPKKELGKGVADQARLFCGVDKDKKITVLKPVDAKNVNFGQAVVKERFYKKTHSSRRVKLIMKNGTYRLIVPFFPGNTYKKDIGTISEDNFLVYCIEVVKALRKCHYAGLVVIDLKADNVIFDSFKKKARLIDGGLSHLKGKVLDSVFILEFEKIEKLKLRQEKLKLEIEELRLLQDIQKAEEKTKELESIQKIQKEKEKRIEKKDSYAQIAFECWSKDTDPKVVADERMDIYSLGDLMDWMLKHKFCQTKKSVLIVLMERLILHCKNPDPALRPSLDQIEARLKTIRIIMRGNREIENSEVDFSWLSSEEQTKEHYDFLMQQLISQATDTEFVSACKMLKVDADYLVNAKKQNIENSYQERLAELEKACKEKQSTLKRTVKISPATNGLFSQSLENTPKRLKTVEKEQVNPNIVKSAPNATAA